MILELTLLFNINYGPFGSGAWFDKKKVQLDEFMANRSAFTEPFKSYLPLICKERGIPEPTTQEGVLAILVDDHL